MNTINLAWFISLNCQNEFTLTKWLNKLFTLISQISQGMFKFKADFIDMV